MNIGILTFHNALNFGAVLQAYATQCVLERYGYDVQIINYENANIKATYQKKVKISSNIKKTLVSIIVFLFNLIRKKKFEFFIKEYLHLSEKVYTESDHDISTYDVLLVGSDQVWNPKQTGGYDKFYWGNFCHKGRLIAWSASAKENAFTENDEEYLRKYLKNFDVITVRETGIRDFLQNYVDMPIKVTLDPTLLLSKNDWLKLCYPVREKNYVLVYAMLDGQNVEQMGKTLAKKTNRELVVLNPIINAKIAKGYKQYASPQDFISYIVNADYIVTSSFHGTAFSILFEKQFFSIIHKGQTNQRIESLLKITHLDNRIVSEINDFQTVLEIDYASVRTFLEVEKSQTLSYLRSIL